MSIRSLINFGDVLPVAAGVSVRLQDNGALDIAFVVIRKEKDTLRVTQMVTGIESYDALATRLNGMLPVGARIHINLEGKGILSKPLPPGDAPGELTDAMKALFPMLRSDDFVAQRYMPSSNQQAVLHVARKEMLMQGIAACDAYAPVSFSLGIYIITPLLALLEDAVIDLPHVRIVREGVSIVGVEPKADSGSVPDLRVGEELIPAAAFVAYAGACSIMVGTPELVFSAEPVMQEGAECYRHRARVYTSARFALGVVLAVLILNAALYFPLQSATQRLEDRGAEVEGQSKRNTDKIRQSRSLMTIYERIGWDSDNMPLFYADRIAAVVNDSIRLTVLEVGVENVASNRQDRQQFYQADRIAVKGEAEDPVALKQMVDQLAIQPWVRKIDDRRYRHDARLGKGIFDFTIHLK